LLNAVKLAADDVGVAATCKRADTSDHDADGTCITTGRAGNPDTELTDLLES